MKNRTVIGIICIILAVVMIFLISPIVNRISGNEVKAIRISKNITQGSEITSDDIETVKVKEDSLPDNVINNTSQIVGKYAAADLFIGDYFIADKL